MWDGESQAVFFFYTPNLTIDSVNASIEFINDLVLANLH